jgi:hypothetical protein
LISRHWADQQYHNENPYPLLCLLQTLDLAATITTKKYHTLPDEKKPFFSGGPKALGAALTGGNFHKNTHYRGDS